MPELQTGGVLSEAQLRRLKEYRYRSTNISILDPVFQLYWNWLTSRLPKWLAPNLITLTGLAVNILSSLLLLYFSPNLRECVPKWACWTAAAGKFIYQSLDAVDGKQARRTKSSSALGELFDHGCDSLSTVFLTLDVCIACQLGLWPRVALFHCILCILLFYCVHWRTYVTGTLHFGVVDVTEAEVAIMAVLITSGTLGSEFWTRKLIHGLHWGQILIICTTPFELFSIYQTFKIVLGEYGKGRNGSTVAGTSVITPVIPVSLALGAMLLIKTGSVERIYENNPALFIIATGITVSKITDHLIVAHMTRSEIKFLDRVLLPCGFMLSNQIFRLGISESTLLWLSLIIVSLDLVAYSWSVATQICRHLNIKFFSV